jgi:hypothetical protein
LGLFQKRARGRIFLEHIIFKKFIITNSVTQNGYEQPFKTIFPVKEKQIIEYFNTP